MRVRVSLRAMWALRDMHQLLLGKAGVLYAWQLWSHKVLRYLCFVFLMGAYGANVLLWSEGWGYKAILTVQTGCYAGAFLSGFLAKKGHRVKWLYLLEYFVLLNFASGHAFCKFIMGKKLIVWSPRRG